MKNLQEDQTAIIRPPELAHHTKLPENATWELYIHNWVACQGGKEEHLHCSLFPKMTTKEGIKTWTSHVNESVEQTNEESTNGFQGTWTQLTIHYSKLEDRWYYVKSLQWRERTSNTLSTKRLKKSLNKILYVLGYSMVQPSSKCSSSEEGKLYDYDVLVKYDCPSMI